MQPSRILKTVWILVLAVALLVPCRIDFIRPGLDPSWIYAVNVAGSLGFKFGTDMLFTYGPLGFLSAACAVGRNIQWALLFTGILLASQLVMLSRFVLVTAAERVGWKRLAFAGGLLWLIPPPPFDSYVLYTVLLALSVAWFEKNKTSYLLWACALATCQLFVKFTGAVSCFSAIGLFWIIWFFKDRQAWRKIWWTPALIPVAFVVGFGIYHPSLTGLLGYVRAAKEISSGYILSMSYAGDYDAGYLLVVLAMGAVYAAFLAEACLRRRRDAAYFFLFAGCVFVAMKHGFVRADFSHMVMAISAMMPMFSLMVLFSEKEITLPRKWWRWGGLVAGAGVLLLGAALWRHEYTPKELKRMREYATSWSRISTLLRIRDIRANPRMGQHDLPPAFLQAVGIHRVAFYPHEMAYAAFNDVRFATMPVFQAYSAYTPYLDECNAAYFRAATRGPAYVVFDMTAINGRWPLIECPRTWAALRENYEVALVDETSLLLKRRVAPEVVQWRLLSDERRDVRDTLLLPEVAGAVSVRVEMKMNALGKLAKMLFRVSPVILKATFADGQTLEGQCIQENLVSETLISFLPTSVVQIASFLDGNRSVPPVKSISFGGPGLAYYRKTVRVSFSEGHPAAPALPGSRAP